jgi:hypothetical protein
MMNKRTGKNSSRTLASKTLVPKTLVSAFAAMIAAFTALGLLMAGCPQETSEQPSSTPAAPVTPAPAPAPVEQTDGLTISGAKDGGIYAVRVYPYTEGCEVSLAVWTEAVSAVNLLAEGEGTAKGGSLLVPLSKLDGSPFMGSGTMLVTAEAFVEGNAAGGVWETRYTALAFTDGSASVKWAELTPPPDGTGARIVPVETGIYRFPDIAVGPAGGQSPTPIAFRLLNTGENTSGRLAVAISDCATGGGTASGPNAAPSSAFLLASPAAIDGIERGGYTDITIVPASELPAGSYTALVRISGADAGPVVFAVTCDVVLEAGGITLSRSGLYAFPTVSEGYGTAVDGTSVSPLNVRVSNSGTSETGPLYVTLSGDKGVDGTSVFSLSGAAIPGIAAGDSAFFTLAPVPGLAAGEYTATVTAAGGDGIEPRSFTASFTVTPPDTPVWGLKLSAAGSLPEAQAGYDRQPAIAVLAVNTGSVPTGALSVSADAPFTADRVLLDSIPVGGSALFAAAVEPGLAAGTYSGKVTVSGAGGAESMNAVSQSVNVRLTVNE